MKKILFILIPYAIFCSGCALQSDVIYIDDRVDAIENRLAKQNMVSGDAEKKLLSRFARLNNQIEKLDEMIRRIEGRFEELDFAFNSQKKIITRLKAGVDAVSKSASGLEVKVQNLESYIGYDTAAAEDSAKPSDSSDKQKKKVAGYIDKEEKTDDIILYKRGRSEFDKGNLESAKKIFAELIAKYPGSDKADNAQFWLGEFYYRNRLFKKAILEYQNVIENFPKGNKVAGAYLKQGLSFLELGQSENSKILLNDVIKQYPDSAEARIARKKIEILKK